jgi:hypothetical protein
MKLALHSYRRSQTRDDGDATAALGEELILYVALCVVGAIPAVSTLARSAAFGVEPTLGLLMVLAGVIGLAGLIVGRDASAR